jgi:predicted DNA binding CopG/RHH family protein
MKLDTDEKEILDSVERGEWRSTGATQRERRRYGRYAEATFRKDRRVNIRLSGKDLEAIQKRALAEGLPYQTLISSLLHKYAAGRLIDGSIVAPGATLKRAAGVNRSRTVDKQLRFAIAHRRLIEVTYHGTVRVAEPYDYGFMRDTAALMMYQVRATGVPQGKSSRGWRLLDVSKIELLRVLEETFPGTRGKASSQLLLVNEMSLDPRHGHASRRRLQCGDIRRVTE